MSDTTLLHGDLTDGIIGVYHQTHYELGDGFLERVCQRALRIALTEAGFHVAEEVPFRVYFRGNLIGEFFADIIVNRVILVEVKSCSLLEPRHRAQAMNYLRASDLEVALLLNFGPKRDFQRLIFTNDRKQRPKTGAA